MVTKYQVAIVQSTKYMEAPSVSAENSSQNPTLHLRVNNPQTWDRQNLNCAPTSFQETA